MTTAPPGIAGLLARWGVPARAELVRAERGTNNQTFAVVLGSSRWALRISENLTAEQVRAEHRLLARLRRAGLPFAVPEPAPTLAGDTVTDTPAGPATLCRWLPGVRPELAGEQAMARFGRAIGLLSEALRDVPFADAPHDWRGDLLGQHPEMPAVAELAPQLSPEHAALLEAAAIRAGTWWSALDRDLPVQVVYGDAAASNTLVDEHTGQVTALLDFEIAGADFRVQDLVTALTQSGALDGAGWPSRVAALMRGHASAVSLSPAEIAAIPPLLICRGIGSVQWRVGRWRRGQAELAEVTERLGYLAATMNWLDTSRERFTGIISGI